MSSDLPNSYYNPPSTLQSGKRKQRTSPNYRAQGQRKFARNPKSKSVVLLPQLGMNLDCRLFIPYVNINVKNNTAPQSSVNNSQDPNGTSIPKSTLQFKTTKNGESDISAGSCSYENIPKVTSQPRFIVEHSINKTPGFGENHLLQVEVRNESDKDCLGSATLGSPSPLKSLTEEGKEEVREEFFCSVCNIDFGFPYLLEEHKNGKEFICRNCTAIFDNHLELEIHFFSHKQFKCEFCGKVFHVKKDLFNHKRTEIKCNKKSLKERCEVCNTRLGSRDSLLRHMERRHPVIELGPFCCPLCSSRFKIEHHLKRHMLVNHEVYEGIECEVCHKIVIGPIKLKFHIKGRHLQSPEICPICNKVLASKFTLKQHMQSHDGEEKICYICGAKVKGEASFRYHMYNHKDTRKTCGICNITFNSSSEKNKHYREIHMKSKVTPSMCELCGKEFKNPTILKNHMMTHSDVKPYECSECGATFKTKAVLKTHSRVHTGFKKYTCNSCGEGFKWRPTFAKHMLKCGNKEEATHNDDAASSS